jgi:hypothetical protein
MHSIRGVYTPVSGIAAAEMQTLIESRKYLVHSSISFDILLIFSTEKAFCYQ